jgi:hypothetical protein
MNNDKSLNGLGGWLILIGIGIVFGPLQMLMEFIPLYSEMFTNGSYEVLTTPGSIAYNPFWAPVVITELLVNILILLTAVYIAVKFFTKKSNFPKWYIGLAVFTLVFLVIDAFAIKLVLPNAAVFDPDTVKEIFLQVFRVLVWVPYMLKSKRVKATFVN